MPPLRAAAAGFIALCVLLSPAAAQALMAPPVSGDMSECNAAAGTNVYKFFVQSLDGVNKTLQEFQDAVLMITNVASF